MLKLWRTSSQIPSQFFSSLSWKLRFPFTREDKSKNVKYISSDDEMFRDSREMIQSSRAISHSQQKDLPVFYLLSAHDNLT